MNENIFPFSLFCFYIYLCVCMFRRVCVCVFMHDFLLICMCWSYFILYISLTHHGLLYNFVVVSVLLAVGVLLLKVDNLYLMLHIKLLKLRVCWPYFLLFICVIQGNCLYTYFLCVYLSVPKISLRGFSVVYFLVILYVHVLCCFHSLFAWLIYCRLLLFLLSMLGWGVW